MKISNFNNSNKFQRNSDVSFSSRIKLVHADRFAKEITDIKHSINFPWTAGEIIKADSAFTKGIMECTAGGIVNGKNVVMFHISTADINNKFMIIENVIKDKLNIKNRASNLQGFLLGSHRESRDYYSARNFKRLEEFMQKLKIPYSKFQGHTELCNNSDIAYKSKTDEWLISNKTFSKIIDKAPSSLRRLLPECFDTINISPKDTLVL